jgi:hypothetical protein
MADQRPPDSYGLDYTGADCRKGEHDRCPGYWGDSLRPGLGTRCACGCHEPATLFVTSDDPGRFTR